MPGTVSGLDTAAAAHPLLAEVQQQGAAQPVGAGGQLGHGQDLEQGKGRAQEQQQGPRRRRAYYPGHGMVGPGGYGNGELLECSALIKVQPVEGTDTIGGKGVSADSGGSNAARLAGGGGRAGATAGRAAGLQHGPQWLTRDDMSTLGDSRKLKLPAWPYLRTFGQEPGTETEGQGQEPAAGQGQGAGSSEGAGAARPYSDFWAGHATWRPYYAMLRQVQCVGAEAGQQGEGQGTCLTAARGEEAVRRDRPNGMHESVEARSSQVSALIPRRLAAIDAVLSRKRTPVLPYRTWKTYQLPWAKSGPITVSSSPGFVAYSKDDWYDPLCSAVGDSLTWILMCCVNC